MMVGRKVEKPAVSVSTEELAAERRQGMMDLSKSLGELTVEHSVDTKLRDRECPDLPVLEGVHHVVLAKLPTGGRVAVLAAMTQVHERLLGLREEIGRLRVVGEREVGDDAEDDAGDALDDHDPAPAGHALDAVHVADAVGEQAAEGAGDGGADEEVADAQGELVLCVEEGQVDVEAREQASLDDAEEQAAGDEGAVGVDEAGEGGDDPPRHGDEGDPAARGEELEDEVGGDLEEEVGHEEQRDGDLELGGREAEVLLELVEPRVADVDAVFIAVLACDILSDYDPVRERSSVLRMNKESHLPS